MTDIDDAGFGAANRWLMDAGDLPPGHCGFEFYCREDEATGDTMIFRVLLAREGRAAPSPTTRTSTRRNPSTYGPPRARS